MNMVFNKYIFAYLCLFYSLTKYFHEFQSIFVNFYFTNISIKIFIDIFDKFIKSKYQYIHNYRYFVVCPNPNKNDYKSECRPPPVQGALCFFLHTPLLYGICLFFFFLIDMFLTLT